VREKVAELLFHRFKVASLGFANSSTMCLFATGRTTGKPCAEAPEAPVATVRGWAGLVVDCGDEMTSVAPVYEVRGPGAGVLQRRLC
jgi:actin-related protein